MHFSAGAIPISINYSNRKIMGNLLIVSQNFIMFRSSIQNKSVIQASSRGIKVKLKMPAINSDRVTRQHSILKDSHATKNNGSYTIRSTNRHAP